jgi:hypothetical protein
MYMQHKVKEKKRKLKYFIFGLRQPWLCSFLMLFC